MTSGLSLSEHENRIAILSGNIRQLTEQAAASLGAQDDERIADRIAQQNDTLQALIQERDALLQKKKT